MEWIFSPWLDELEKIITVLAEGLTSILSIVVMCDAWWQQLGTIMNIRKERALSYCLATVVTNIKKFVTIVNPKLCNDSNSTKHRPMLFSFMTSNLHASVSNVSTTELLLCESIEPSTIILDDADIVMMLTSLQ
jgi:hypothetical protein